MYISCFSLDDEWRRQPIGDANFHTLTIDSLRDPGQLEAVLQSIGQKDAAPFLMTQVAYVLGNNNMYIIDSAEWSEKDNSLTLKGRTPDALLDRVRADARGTLYSGTTTKALATIVQANLRGLPYLGVSPAAETSTLTDYDPDGKTLLEISEELLDPLRFYWWKYEQAVEGHQIIQLAPLRFTLTLEDRRTATPLLASDIDGSITLVGRKIDYSILQTRVRGKSSIQADGKQQTAWTWQGTDSTTPIFREGSIDVEAKDGWSLQQAQNAAAASARAGLRSNPETIDVRVNATSPHPVGTQLNAWIGGSGNKYIVSETRVEEDAGTQTIEETLEVL
jgi:hypothetical protein